MVGVDAHPDRSAQLDRIGEHVPDRVVDRLDADDGDGAAGVVDPPDVAHLAATTGVQCRAVEHDAAGLGVDDRRLVLVQVGLLVAEVHGHVREPTGMSFSSSVRLVRGTSV